MVPYALEARALLADQGIAAAVYNFASIEPLPVDAVVAAAATGAIVTVEDHSVWGGLGTRIAERCVAVPVVLRKMGVRGYQSSGPCTDLYREAGLTAEQIAETVRAAVAAKGQSADRPNRAATAAG